MSIDGKTVGLALSGGGYRASLFGLGSLWRLNDAGLLGRLDRITSVSGGSILSGVLAHQWKALRFEDGRATNFVGVVAAGVQAFCAGTIDVETGLLGMLVPFKSAGDFLKERYAKDLFGSTTLKDLPAPAEGTPLFTFYATNLQTGRSFRFRQDKVADYLLGETTTVAVPLATAVAASSAFPPLFSPVVLETDPALWVKTDLTLADPDPLRRHILLADGGIYDNMGLEQLTGTGTGHADIVLVSDAGAPFEIELKPAADYAFQLGRVRDILIDQTRALRKRWLIDEFTAGRKRGAYWGVTTEIAHYAGATPLVADSAVTRSMAAVPTRLAALSPEVQGRLINWGYALCDAALRAHSGLQVPAAPGLPLPQHAL